MRPGIDFIVVDYQTPADLSGFLTSLVEFPPEVPWSLTVALVSPGPEDERVAKEFGVLHDTVQFTKNVGYARAVNRASIFGDHETLAIFNADTKLTKGVATECHNALHSNPAWAIVGPRQIDERGTITHGGIFQSERGFHQPNSEEYGDVREDATTVSGSAYFIKRAVWKELTNCPHYAQYHAEGAFLPTQHYYEETWCSWHARAHRYKVVYYGAATMIHKWHASSPRGGYADKQVTNSKRMFEEACAAHGENV